MLQQRILITCIALLGSATGCIDQEPVATTSTAQGNRLPPIYTIRIHGLATADNDGSNASPVTATALQSRLTKLNEVFATARIAIAFDPEHDFEQIDSTLLNQRFSVIGNVESYTDPNTPPPTSRNFHQAARFDAASARRGKVTIFFSMPEELVYDNTKGHWTLVPTSGNGGSSGGLGRWVSWRGGTPSATSLAHEIGHYLGNQHPQVGGIENVEQAAAKIKAFVNAGASVDDGLLALDADHTFVRDTPADAGGTIFNSYYGTEDKCSTPGSLPIDVEFSSTLSKEYTLAPDRDLAMSYWKGCPWDFRFSSDQSVRMWDALDNLHRRDLVTVKPTAFPTSLELGGLAGAGSIDDVQIVRVNQGRVVTATRSNGSLKLIVWDVSTDGQSITRRGDVVVGAAGPYQVTHGGLHQVLVAYRDGGGALAIRSYRVAGDGSLSLVGSGAAGGILDVAIARLDRLLFITPVRLSNNTMRVIAWQVIADGTIERIAHADGGAVTEIDAVAYNSQRADSIPAIGAATIFARTTAGNLETTTWELRDTKPRTLVQIDAEAAGEVSEIAAAPAYFDQAVSVVRTSSGVQKVIAWHPHGNGVLDRKASYTSGSCLRVAAAPIGTELLATACREPDTNKLRMRLFQIGDNADSVTLRHEHDPFALATELALAPVHRNMVISATRSGQDNLLLAVWKLDVNVVFPPPE